MSTPTPPANPSYSTAARPADRPWPAAIVLEGWTRTVALARSLAVEADPRRLSDVEVMAVQSLGPHLAAAEALRLFVAYAEAEQELTSIPEDDYSAEAAVRRGELAVEAANALRTLLAGHPWAPAWPHGQPEDAGVYAAELVANLRADVRDRDERVAALRRRNADLEAANLSLEQLVDVYRPSGVTLTAAGVAATGGAKVLELPLAGGR